MRGRLAVGISPGNINREMAVVRRILNLCARLWRDESDRPWLDTSPLTQMQCHPNKREPYPLSIDEQRLLSGHVTTHHSAPEIEALIQAAEKVCELGARKSHALTIVRSREKQQVFYFIGGERGTRTRRRRQ